MEADLRMTGYDYNIAVLAYYPGVMLCELPSNMILSRVQPRYLFAVLVFGFGITVTMAGFAKNLASLVVARFFIGGEFSANLDLKTQLMLVRTECTNSIRNSIRSRCPARRTIPTELVLQKARATYALRYIHVLDRYCGHPIRTSWSRPRVTSRNCWVLWLGVDFLRKARLILSSTVTLTCSSLKAVSRALWL